MASVTYLGLIPETTASGANATYNLANSAIGTDAVGLGIIAANPSGPLGAVPTDGGPRGLSIVVDNRGGTADAYLCRPEDIPTAGTETVTIGGYVFPAGQITEYSDIEVKNFPFILRLLDGASVRGTVGHTGASWSIA